jgi:hypothetical protein
MLMAVAAESLTVPMEPLAHVVLLAPAVGWLWLLEVLQRPLRHCPRCDSGRNWDSAHVNFGEFCRRCGQGRGKILRPGARAFVAFGAGHLLRNLPDSMRGARRGDR